MGVGGSKFVVPAGSGEYGVGFVDLMLVGSSFTRFYYPTLTKSKCGSDWVPRLEYLEGLGTFLQRSPSTFPFFFRRVVGWPRLPATEGAAVSAAPPRLPLVVFSPGLGGFRGCYAAVCCDLASHGYLVATVEHRDESSCWTYKAERQADGSVAEVPLAFKTIPTNDFTRRNAQIEIRISECKGALSLVEKLNESGSKAFDNAHIGAQFDWDQFKDRVDLSRAAVMGHSFGGGTAIGSLAAESGFRAGVGLDAWLFPLTRSLFRAQGAIRQPLLLLNASQFKWPDNLAAMRRFWADGSHAPRLMLTARRSTHASMSDFTYFLGSWLGQKARTRSETPPEVQTAMYFRVVRAWLAQQMDIPDGEDLSAVVAEYGAELIPDTPHIEVDPVDPAQDAIVDSDLWEPRPQA